MSFWEVLVIVVVGLLVVGPDRLPEAIRSGMLWFGRVKRTINETRVDFEQQLGVDEIRRELHNEKIMDSLKALEDVHRKAEKEVARLDATVREGVEHIEGEYHTHSSDEDGHDSSLSIQHDVDESNNNIDSTESDIQHAPDSHKPHTTP